MRTIKIGKSYRFDTVEGLCEVLGYNGSIVDCQEYIYNDDTCECDIIGDVRRLTLNEIALELKNVDELNYKVIWDN